ncbi:MAG: phosphoribosylglycinamide formyltransferase [Ferruginibacter sp.]
MLKKLREKWNVNSRDFIWILVCFAVTGSITAWVSKVITTWITVEKWSASWWMLKGAVLFIGYPIFLLIIGYCLGQFNFFGPFVKKLYGKKVIVRTKNERVNIAIFASGAGSNAREIIRYFQHHSTIHVKLIVSNKPGAGVIQVAETNGISYKIINKPQMHSGDFVLYLKAEKIDWVILAGFLLKIPPALLEAYPNKIINLHPALLPAYGGAGMYGKYVHEAVLANKETQSGITIHYVDDVYDHGEIISRFECPVNENDTVESLAEKIHALEHRHFAGVIESTIINAK